MNVFYQIKLQEKLVEEDVPCGIIDNRKKNWKKKIKVKKKEISYKKIRGKKSYVWKQFFFG